MTPAAHGRAIIAGQLESRTARRNGLTQNDADVGAKFSDSIRAPHEPKPNRSPVAAAPAERRRASGRPSLRTPDRSPIDQNRRERDMPNNPVILVGDQRRRQALPGAQP